VTADAAVKGRSVGVGNLTPQVFMSVRHRGLCLFLAIIGVADPAPWSGTVYCPDRKRSYLFQSNLLAPIIADGTLPHRALNPTWARRTRPRVMLERPADG
jgi:hypothetical protein